MAIEPKRAVVMAHYDRDGVVDAYVYHYINCLLEICDNLVFVSTAKIKAGDYEYLEKLCTQVIVRENVGYDFMSYQVGLECLDKSKYDEIIICNDSVYGPLFDFKEVFKGMQSKKCDFWGITESNDIAWHLQSYFVVFLASAIRSNAFKRFWVSVDSYEDKRMVVEKNEVGLSQVLVQAGLKGASYVALNDSYGRTVGFIIDMIVNKVRRTISDKEGKEGKEKKRAGFKKRLRWIYNRIQQVGSMRRTLNPTHFFWKEIIVRYRFPFIKVELIRDNPALLDISDYRKVLRKHSKYNIELIESHQRRMAIRSL